MFEVPSEKKKKPKARSARIDLLSCSLWQLVICIQYTEFLCATFTKVPVDRIIALLILNNIKAYTVALLISQFCLNITE